MKTSTAADARKPAHRSQPKHSPPRGAPTHGHAKPGMSGAEWRAFLRRLDAALASGAVTDEVASHVLKVHRSFADLNKRHSELPPRLRSPGFAKKLRRAAAEWRERARLAGVAA